MKALIILTFFISIHFSSFSQDLETELKLTRQEISRINFQIDSLTVLINMLEDKVDSINIVLFKSESVYIVKWDYKEIKKGENAEIVEAGSEWTIINTRQKKNYKIPTYYLVKEEEFAEFEKESKFQMEEEIANRNSYLIQKFGKTATNKILAKEVWIGMTTEMTVESWGIPNDINRTVGDWGIHEQWVYPDNKYLYFENGKLTSWQD